MIHYITEKPIMEQDSPCSVNKNRHWNERSVVTVQYLHSYDAKSIPNRLRRWDFALLNHFLTVSAVNASTCTEWLRLQIPLRFYKQIHSNSKAIEIPQIFPVIRKFLWDFNMSFLILSIPSYRIYSLIPITWFYNLILLLNPITWFYNLILLLNPII